MYNSHDNVFKVCGFMDEAPSRYVTILLYLVFSKLSKVAI